MIGIFNRNKRYNICFSLDNNYCEQLSVAIVSILKSAKKNEKFNFIVLNDKISQENKEIIENLKSFKDFTIKFIDLDINEFSDFPIIKEDNEKYKGCCITRAAYFKYKLASLLDNIDKVLYLDCDLIVQDSLAKLYNFDIKDHYAAMTEDVKGKSMAAHFKISNYYNSGVMLINLKKWREDNLEEKFLNCTNQNREFILWADQDVFNIVMEGKIKTLPSIWNYQFFLQDTHDQDNFLNSCSEYKILHYAGSEKPWTCIYNHAVFDKYYKILEQTPYGEKILAYNQKKYSSIYQLIAKSVWEQINDRIKIENDYIYKFVCEQMDDRMKREKDYIYNLISEQINDRIKIERDNLYNFISEQISVKIKNETESMYNAIIKELGISLGNK